MENSGFNGVLDLSWCRNSRRNVPSEWWVIFREAWMGRGMYIADWWGNGLFQPLSCLFALLGSRQSWDWPYLGLGLSRFQFQTTSFGLAHNCKLCKSDEVTVGSCEPFFTSTLLSFWFNQWLWSMVCCYSPRGEVEGRLFVLGPHPFTHSSSLGPDTATHFFLVPVICWGTSWWARSTPRPKANNSRASNLRRECWPVVRRQYT